MTTRSAKSLRKKLEGLSPMDRDEMICRFAADVSQEFFAALLIERGIDPTVAHATAGEAWNKHGRRVLS